MTSDVRIRHCTITVRRRGGWAWPSDPSDHLRAAVDAVERVVTAAVERAGLSDDADVYVRDPVRLRIGSDGVAEWPDGPPLADLLRDLGVHQAHPHERGAPPREPDRGPASGRGSPSRLSSRPAPDGDIPAAISARGLARTLEQWSQSGHVGTIVGRWPVTAVRRWLAQIDRASRAAGTETASVAPEAVRRIAATMGIGKPGTVTGHVEARATLLHLVAALVGAAGGRLPDLATLRVAAEVCGTTWLEWPDPGTAHTRLDATDLPTDHHPHTTEPPDPRQTWEVPPMAVTRAPALPFLILVQLVRIGFASAMVAAADGRAEVLRAMAAGIAGKVLPPPARGWHREPADDAAITAASGLDPATLSRVSARLQAEDAALARTLRDALLSLRGDGRPRSDPVEVTDSAHGIVCGDVLGSLPLAWIVADELDDVRAVLGNPPTHRSDHFTGFAADFAARRAFPGVELPALERTLGAAAGVALGSLGYELWADETDEVSPALLLERFTNFEARVETTDRLIVAIPRGRRWLDLHRHGLIDAWEVPWSETGLWELVTW